MVSLLRKPRLFISHVNGDPGGEAIWPVLRDHLAAKFDVLVDREVIRAGALWRNQVLGLIGMCDAAVILISQQALADPAKHWVARETACLVYRRYHDPSLKIIPVLLDGITFEKLEATERFRDLQLKETQCLSGDDVEVVTKGVAEGLRDLQPTEEKTALLKVAYYIRGILAGFAPNEIEGVLAASDVDFGAWTEKSDPALRLALAMLTRDISELPRILGMLFDLNADQHKRIKKIKDFLLPNWVELEAVGGLVEEGMKRSGDRSRRALRLNYPEERMARLYASRAFPDVLPEWKFLSLNCVFGECSDMADAKQQLFYEIEKEITRKITIGDDARVRDETSKRADRLRRCRLLADKRQPVFVTAKLGTGLEELLRNAMAEYDFATFLLRSEVDTSDDGLPLKLVRPLTPALSDARYQSFRDLEAEFGEKLNPTGDGA
jgi:hypothetical protein